MDKYKKFKHLLEYFVSHLEWVENSDPAFPGYVRYIRPVENFYKAGQGWNGGNIQHQIEKWADYDGDTLYLSVYSANYKSKACYLNWEGTYHNIRAIWNGSHVESLYLSLEEKAQAKAEYTQYVSALGLFDGKEPNFNLKKFFDKFIYMHNGISDLAAECVSLLTANHNLVLTGAPGTGKTFLAHEIARALGATKENGGCEMVQFHPSYDYTDFVEGLRPFNDDETKEYGFRLEPGTFKKFCQKALENLLDSEKSVSEISHEELLKEAYDRFVNDIENGDNDHGKVLPLRSGEMDIVGISENSNIYVKSQNGKSDRTYTISFNRLRKLAGAFPDIKSLDAVSNLAKAVRDVINGCNASSYWAALRYIYAEYMPAVKGSVTPLAQKVDRRNFVFIIDEINRGDMSKILGELFFSIDPGYRGPKGTVKTQYANLIDPGDPFDEGFFVPENVHIIGTMNDIDRSVDSMDFAIRRRFAWKEITAKARQTMLDSEEAWGEGLMPDPDVIAEIKTRMNNLNAAIIGKYKASGNEETMPAGLDEAYQIGAAYFLKYRLYQNFEELWQNHLLGLLREYLRGDPDLDYKIARFKAAFDDTDTHE